jgi:hypothetical protein
VVAAVARGIGMHGFGHGVDPWIWTRAKNWSW